MQLDRDKFAELIGKTFVLKGAEDQSVDVELVDVGEVQERPHQRSFSILFLTPQGSIVGQGLYELEHEGLETMQLFLVPVGIADGRIQLEAVFNFLPEKTETNV